MKNKICSKSFDIFNNIIMCIVVMLTLYPFLFLVAQSFSSEKAIYAGKITIFPVGFSLNTYLSIIIKGDFFGYYGNTLIYAMLGTIISLFLTATLAYPLSKDYLPINKYITPFVVFTMYFAGGLIPNFVLINAIGMRNTIWAITIPGAINTYYLLLMKSFFSSIPKELEEAASIDGLDTIGIFMNIILPLSKPIIFTMILFYAAGIWSNWFTPFIYLDGKDRWPVALYLREIIYGATSANELTVDSLDGTNIGATVKSCAMVLMTLPIIIVSPFIQKYFVQGIMLGAVKE